MNNYRFIDLFAGIGGFRLAFENKKSKCVFSSESNQHAKNMYFENFKETPAGDITQIKESEIPPHDILLAGFPCQPFSIAGLKKGFQDSRGILFFDVLRILKYHNPSTVILENVKHFKNHDKGNTLKIILQSLIKLGYQMSWDVLNARDFGLPQNRERTIIIGQKNYVFDFSVLKKQKHKILKDILIDHPNYLNKDKYTLIDKPKIQTSGLIFSGYLNKKMINKNAKHLSRSHRQPNRIYSVNGVHPTLLSKEPSGRYYISIGQNVRKLTLLECYRLMGFPDHFKKIGCISDQYNRIGNSIAVPMVESIAKQIIRVN